MTIEAQIPSNEMIIDLFAGAGGASVGIERAAGRPADVAINHDRRAIEMHSVNHPGTKHFISDVWEVDPIDATGGRPVGLLWMSPDCKHFSRAKGTTPVQASVRALADVLHTWIAKAPPRIIILENVQEFEDWGPLLETDKGLRPDPNHVGETFKAWLAKIVDAGYSVEFKPMNAADFGAPTTRIRFFLIARRDRDTVIFPDATHAKGGQDGRAPWVPVADVINWDHSVQSIFTRRRPLAENTVRRIAQGMKRYVYGGSPYIVEHARYDGVSGAVEDQNLVVPWLIKHYGGMIGNPISDTLGTITTRDSQSLATATLARAGSMPQCPKIAAFLVKYFGTAVAQPLNSPLGTLTTKDRYALVEVRGVEYQIADIGMRMLQPDELFRAQGFHDGYNHTIDSSGGRFTKTEQTRFVGNSVCPDAAHALVSAQILS